MEVGYTDYGMTLRLAFELRRKRERETYRFVMQVADIDGIQYWADRPENQVATVLYLPLKRKAGILWEIVQKHGGLLSCKGRRGVRKEILALLVKEEEGPEKMSEWKFEDKPERVAHLVCEYSGIANLFIKLKEQGQIARLIIASSSLCGQVQIIIATEPGDEVVTEHFKFSVKGLAKALKKLASLLEKECCRVAKRLRKTGRSKGFLTGALETFHLQEDFTDDAVAWRAWALITKCPGCGKPLKEEC